MATLTLQQQCSSVQQQGMYDLLDANNTTMGAHKRVYNEVADMVSQGGSKHKVLIEEHTTQGTHRGTHNTRYSQRNTQHKVLTEEHTTQGTHRGTHNTRHSQRNTQHKALTEGHTTQGTHRGTQNTRYSQRDTQHKVLTEGHTTQGTHRGTQHSPQSQGLHTQRPGHAAHSWQRVQPPQPCVAALFPTENQRH